MNKNKYNFILLAILLFSDFFSGTISYRLTIYNNITFSLDLFFLIFSMQCCWSAIFFFADLYNTRATLSRFDEIIRLVPIIYSTLVFFIILNIIGIVDYTIEYKDILTFGLVFSTILIINRFIIHSVQKFLLNKKALPVSYVIKNFLFFDNSLQNFFTSSKLK